MKFGKLRTDGYYFDYVYAHELHTSQQQHAYDSGDIMKLIKASRKKAENLEEYISRAGGTYYLGDKDYDRIEKIIKNDQRMLKYRQCEKILDRHDPRLEETQYAYNACLSHFEAIQQRIDSRREPYEERPAPEPSPAMEYKPKPDRDFDFDL